MPDIPNLALNFEGPLGSLLLNVTAQATFETVVEALSQNLGEPNPGWCSLHPAPQALNPQPKTLNLNLQP